jgi:hypothetical protein
MFSRVAATRSTCSSRRKPPSLVRASSVAASGRSARRARSAVRAVARGKRTRAASGIAAKAPSSGVRSAPRKKERVPSATWRSRAAPSARRRRRRSERGARGGDGPLDHGVTRAGHRRALLARGGVVEGAVAHRHAEEASDAEGLRARRVVLEVAAEALLPVVDAHHHLHLRRRRRASAAGPVGVERADDLAKVVALVGVVEDAPSGQRGEGVEHGEGARGVARAERARGVAAEPGRFEEAEEAPGAVVVAARYARPVPGAEGLERAAVPERAGARRERGGAPARGARRPAPRGTRGGAPSRRSCGWRSRRATIPDQPGSARSRAVR